MPFLEKRVGSIDVRERTGADIDHSGTDPWARDEYTPGPVSKDAVWHRLRHEPDRQTCGNSECAGGWKMPWKNRKRPIFESCWGCSTRCLEAIIRKALRRERGDMRSALSEDAPHRHRVPLGLIMLSQGLITQRQLRQALEAQRSAGHGRIGDWLMQECAIPSAHVIRGLAVQWSCPVLPLDGFAPAAMALTVPRIFLEEFKLLPLRVAASRILYLAFNDRLDATAAFAIEQMSDLTVVSGLLDDVPFQQAHHRIFDSRFVAVQQEYFMDADMLATKIAAILHQSQAIGSRLVRLHQHYWLRLWLEAGAYSGVGSLPGTGEDVTDTIFTFSG
jgi:hypothetical protein